ncbi:hypothetical protein BC939DRAFT_479182 [Gamsiella multidivaricata]|uniref:uncharacterized protein n=1 Tax=Gamsiella multidivaricata TaxID=101098 RepID=UPI00221E3DBA|nr:uncharacterized protein BC939DRAFT_479182 [Gamsiella multidivaricata]KAI7820033.1 hypothetical protein BC939DRAFT_479182 [Gamsiella multidivaricata]
MFDDGESPFVGFALSAPAYFGVDDALAVAAGPDTGVSACALAGGENAGSSAILVAFTRVRDVEDVEDVEDVKAVLAELWLLPTFTPLSEVFATGESVAKESGPSLKAIGVDLVTCFDELAGVKVLLVAGSGDGINEGSKGPKESKDRVDEVDSAALTPGELAIAGFKLSELGVVATTGTVATGGNRCTEIDPRADVENGDFAVNLGEVEKIPTGCRCIDPVNGDVPEAMAPTFE